MNVICHEEELVQVNFDEEVTFSLAPLNLDDCGRTSPDLLLGNERMNRKHMCNVWHKGDFQSIAVVYCDNLNKHSIYLYLNFIRFILSVV